MTSAVLRRTSHVFGECLRDLSDVSSSIRLTLCALGRKTTDFELCIHHTWFPPCRGISVDICSSSLLIFTAAESSKPVSKARTCFPAAVGHFGGSDAFIHMLV